eukprot:TRINITY_DN20899_c0_g1_i1.p1 TRINITY_DN20899_c0_g1~~TRINITY_DN20899_c0_g1_i1.p1  ORF type:complete len:338 (+),score=64.13 TRINITY_DN20899_c0_g1_i1:82-1014(+)
MNSRSQPSSDVMDRTSKSSVLLKTIQSHRSSIAWCDTPTVYEGVSSTESESTTTIPSAPVMDVRRNPGWGWRLTRECVRRILVFVQNTKDLRSCTIVCKRWRSSLGHPQGALGLRVMNPWQPYSGCWWLPKDAFTIMLVSIDTEDRYQPKGKGMMLEKVVRERPSLLGSGYDVTVEQHQRDVSVELSPTTAIIRWFKPIKTMQGTRSGAAINTSVFDCSAVITLSNITNPSPGRVVPKQLYLSPRGGTLKTFPDSHLRRPKSHASYHDLQATARYLAKVLERSDWVSITSTCPDSVTGHSKLRGKHLREI